MLIDRLLKPHLIRLAKQYPVVTITGPRQSGKTTLSKQAFPNKPYISMESLDARRFAEKDPVEFLNQFPDGAILDEIQRTPHLFSYLQTIVDARKKDGLFILTGSCQFELLTSITQSLAGRTAIIKLLPFSFMEIYAQRKRIPSLNMMLFKGFYPRIFDKKLNPTEALSFYTTTYIERDVRSLLNVKDLSQFELFLKLCAGRTGQILNLSNLANDCGINHNTAKSWISVLEASYIIFLIRPHHKNFNKRLIKSPKLYFYDVGLATFLLDIQNENHIDKHPLRGALFETLIISEFLKARYNQVKTNNLYYFRDNIGNEIDLLLDYGNTILPVEIKSGQTIADDFLKNLNFYSKISSNAKESILIYTGDHSYRDKNIQIIPFKKIQNILSSA